MNFRWKPVLPLTGMHCPLGYHRDPVSFIAASPPLQLICIVKDFGNVTTKLRSFLETAKGEFALLPRPVNVSRW